MKLRPGFALSLLSLCALSLGCSPPVDAPIDDSSTAGPMAARSAEVTGDGGSSPDLMCSGKQCSDPWPTPPLTEPEDVGCGQHGENCFPPPARVELHRTDDRCDEAPSDVEAQAMPEAPGTFCTNGQCFPGDGGSGEGGPPGGGSCCTGPCCVRCIRMPNCDIGDPWPLPATTDQ